MRKPIESQAMLLVFLFFYYQCPKTTYKSNHRRWYHHNLLFPANTHTHMKLTYLLFLGITLSLPPNTYLPIGAKKNNRAYKHPISNVIIKHIKGKNHSSASLTIDPQYYFHLEHIIYSLSFYYTISAFLIPQSLELQN